MLWLNAMSMMLDLQLSRSLMGTGDRQQDYDPLFAHPDADAAELHARYVGTAPAATREVVERAGGTILEAGPASTTVIVGDTENPTRVITLVAGATTGTPEKLEGELVKANRLAQQTGAAVVVWQGYSPPPLLVDALSPTWADGGADDLSMFQAALDERYPDAQKTVVSHSYGTLVATKAAHEHGLIADDLWLLGSAGVDGEHVSELTLASPDASVYVVDSPTDPILLLASTSPSRAKLLRDSGIAFDQLGSEVDEDAVVSEAGLTEPSEIALALARAKCEAVAALPQAAGRLVIGCDSVFELDGHPLGKPYTAAVARERIGQMRGRTGHLHTGHWLIDTRSPDDGGENSERAIDVQMTRLRRKLERDPREPRYLQTVRGTGYMLVPD